jgi:hypothetical protein
MMIKIALTFCILIAGTAFSHAASHCTVPFVKFIPGVTNTGYMWVKSGKSCKITVSNSLGGATQGPEVKQKPSNGTLTVSGLGLTYTPKAGFVGKDRFEYLRHNLDHRTNKPVSGGIIVEVTVQPGDAS